MESNDNAGELKDSIGEVFATITPKMFRQFILSVRLRLSRCVQVGSQSVENRGEAANLRFRQGGEGHQLFFRKGAAFASWRSSLSKA